MIINSNYSIEEVGLFSFALNLTSIITMIGLGFNQVNSVDIYKILGDNEHDNKWKLKKLDNELSFRAGAACVFFDEDNSPTYDYYRNKLVSFEELSCE